MSYRIRSEMIPMTIKWHGYIFKIALFGFVKRHRSLGITLPALEHYLGVLRRWRLKMPLRYWSYLWEAKAYEYSLAVTDDGISVTLTLGPEDKANLWPTGLITKESYWHRFLSPKVKEKERNLCVRKSQTETHQFPKQSSRWWQCV